MQVYRVSGKLVVYRVWGFRSLKVGTLRGGCQWGLERCCFHPDIRSSPMIFGMPGGFGVFKVWDAVRRDNCRLSWTWALPSLAR